MDWKDCWEKGNMPWHIEAVHPKFLLHVDKITEKKNNAKTLMLSICLVLLTKTMILNGQISFLDIHTIFKYLYPTVACKCRVLNNAGLV